MVLGEWSVVMGSDDVDVCECDDECERDLTDEEIALILMEGR